MLTLNDGRKELYQWDTGRKATVDIECYIVHFANLKYGESLAVEVKAGVVSIPNKLLMIGEPIHCWAFAKDANGAYTKKEQTFAVIKRAKPSDYVYTETEVITVQKAVENALQEAKASGDFKGEKGDPGETGAKGDKGDPGNVDGITVEGVDLPVEAGKVALPIVTDTSESMATGDSALGLCKIPPFSMLYASGGAIDVKEANPSVIAQRSSPSGDLVLTAPYVNDIVKAALTDENRIRGLTDLEKKNACSTIGSVYDGLYELIEEITLSENVDSITRSTDMQGNSYNFKSVLIYANLSANTENSTLRVYVNGLKDTSITAQNAISTGARYDKMVLSCNGGVISGTNINATTLSGTTNITSTPLLAFGHNAITSINIVATKGIPSGSNIKIYAVRT